MKITTFKSEISPKLEKLYKSIPKEPTNIDTDESFSKLSFHAQKNTRDSQIDKSSLLMEFSI